MWQKYHSQLLWYLGSPLFLTALEIGYSNAPNTLRGSSQVLMNFHTCMNKAAMFHCRKTSRLLTLVDLSFKRIAWRIGTAVPVRWFYINGFGNLAPTYFFGKTTHTSPSKIVHGNLPVGLPWSLGRAFWKWVHSLFFWLRDSLKSLIILPRHWYLLL